MGFCHVEECATETFTTLLGQATTTSCYLPMIVEWKKWKWMPTSSCLAPFTFFFFFIYFPLQGFLISPKGGKFTIYYLFFQIAHFYRLYMSTALMQTWYLLPISIVYYFFSANFYCMHALTAHKLITTCEFATVNVFSSFRKTKIERTLYVFRIVDKCLGLNVHCIMVFFIQQRSCLQGVNSVIHLWIQHHHQLVVGLRSVMYNFGTSE